MHCARFMVHVPKVLQVSSVLVYALHMVKGIYVSLVSVMCLLGLCMELIVCLKYVLVHVFAFMIRSIRYVFVLRKIRIH